MPLHDCSVSGERKGANLCDGCKHFLQHCIGLSSSSGACLDVEALGTWAGNKPVRGEDVRDGGHSVVWMWPTGPARPRDQIENSSTQWLLKV